jgi:hypothetical protein
MNDGPRFGRHLGAVDPSTGTWIWKAADTWGGLNGHGAFDSFCAAYGQNLTVGTGHVIGVHRGEFWRGDGESNQLLDYDAETGLFIGQFGKPGIVGMAAIAPMGAAGNIFWPQLTRPAGGYLYLYTGGESSGGLPRWRLQVDGPNRTDVPLP